MQSNSSDDNLQAEAQESETFDLGSSSKKGC